MTAFQIFGTDIHGHNHNHNHNHSHNHSHSHSHEKLPHQQGIFEDSAVKDRDISDYSGEWQSVYPMMKNGELLSVMEAKATASGAKMTTEEYTAYYLTGYETNMTKIRITDDGIMDFYAGNDKFSGKYEYAGLKILTYASGKK